MSHALVPFLAAAAKTTTTAPPAAEWVYIVVSLAVGVGLAEWRRRRRGAYPWRLPSVVWGIFVVLTYGLALVLMAIAWFTTKPRPTDVRGRQPSALATRLADRIAGRSPALPQEPAGSGVTPGTYGTSLPPHDASGDALAPHDGTLADAPWGEPAAFSTVGATLPSAPRDASGEVSDPGWLADPTGRHEHRYWNGSVWSQHVSDGGQRSRDEI